MEKISKELSETEIRLIVTSLRKLETQRRREGNREEEEEILQLIIKLKKS